MSGQAKKPAFDPETIEAYLLGQLSYEEVKALDRALRGDPELREHLAQAMRLMSLVRQEFAGREQYDTAHRKEPLLQDFGALLQELGTIEANAETITLPVETVDEAVTAEPSGLSAGDFTAAAGYVLRRLVCNKAAMSAAAAAVVLLCVVFFMDWGGESGAPIAEQPPANPNAAIQTPARSVRPAATLTAQRDAVWARSSEAALAPGSALRAGQRFTLTQGFAEITTSRGAVAILEAPAAIELLDLENALHLHTGKLVGICETASSKGFLVRTPHMDITDIGTRFAVDATDPGRTEVHVYAGRVRAEMINSPQLIELSEGQAAAANLNESSFVMIDADVSLLAGAIRLLTGVVSLEGEVRLHEQQQQAVTPGLLESDDHIWLVPEHERFELTQPLLITFTEPGTYRSFRKQQSMLQPQAVRTYLLTLDPVGDTIENQTVSRSATIRFDSEILGVAANHVGLTKSSKLMAPPGSNIAVFGDGLEGIDGALDDGDTLRISGDRRSLGVTLAANNRVDQVRVFVRVPHPTSQ